MGNTFELKPVKKDSYMKQVLFFISMLFLVNSIHSSDDSLLLTPPDYNAEFGVYGSPPVASAPSAQNRNDYDPAKDVLEKANSNPTVYTVNNSTCVCLCPLPVNVSIIPILHKISPRLSLALCGSTDSPDTTKNNHADHVDMRKLPENKEKWV